MLKKNEEVIFFLILQFNGEDGFEVFVNTGI